MKNLFLIFAILFVAFTSFLFADDIGNYRIPMKVRYADTVVDPGTYAISIVKETDGPYIVLSKGGQVVAKDLSIEIPAASSISKPQVQIAKIAGQDFLRVRIRSGSMWYYAYMETKW
jgi:hypothetical protein